MKNGKVLSAVMFVLLLTATLSFPQKPSAGQNEETAAKLIATYFVKARGVLALNQPLINDSGKGDKGFTPAVYEEQFTEDFGKMTGKNVKQLNPSDPVEKVLADLHESAKEAVADAQPMINEPGKGFKGFSPAIFGKKTADKFFKRSGILVKQTSIKFRAQYNAPDDFEKNVLKKFKSGWERGKVYSEITTAGGKKAVRYMLPVYITLGCLPCHGDPAGETDIAGRKKEGYKTGELRGAISVTVPIK